MVRNALPRVQHPIYWPRGVRIIVYDEDRAVVARSRDRTYDLVDNVFLHDDDRIVYVGVAVHSKNWRFWNTETLERIEERIRWDMEFDALRARIKRTSRPGGPCSKEFVWKVIAS